MSEHDFFEESTELIRKLQEYPEEKIEAQLANLNERIDNVVSYQRIEDESGKNNPVYYQVKKIQNLHNSAIESYTNTYIPTDFKSKASLMGELVNINSKLIKVEGRNGDYEG